MVAKGLSQAGAMPHCTTLYCVIGESASPGLIVKAFRWILTYPDRKVKDNRPGEATIESAYPAEGQTVATAHCELLHRRKGEGVMPDKFSGVQGSQTRRARCRDS